ncbi:MAG: hypothetical protein HUK03_07425 [Bacteroidaceae bacterium]|nr:hypothetical protein [Bacteroidaceae bacterium]
MRQQIMDTCRTLHVHSVSDILALDAQEEIRIDTVNWTDYPTGPTTSFRIARVDERLCIKFVVRETNPRIVNTQDLQSVWEDSCVEFFCQKPGDTRYFNFEFNARGVCLASSRISRDEGVEYLLVEQLRQIRRTAEIGGKAWSLLVEIPLSLIAPDFMPPLTLHVNFYKCGDKCVRPHYLSWNPIHLPKPMFHCPQYFGKAVID